MRRRAASTVALLIVQRDRRDALGAEKEVFNSPANDALLHMVAAPVESVNPPGDAYLRSPGVGTTRTSARTACAAASSILADLLSRPRHFLQ